MADVSAFREGDFSGEMYQMCLFKANYLMADQPDRTKIRCYGVTPGPLERCR